MAAMMQAVVMQGTRKDGCHGKTLPFDWHRAFLQKKFGFTPENIVLAAKEQIAKTRRTMRHPITRDRYEAVLFDMDGVVTDTVSIHATCWKTMFDEFLKKWAAQKAEPFRSFDVVTDYKLHVDGKPRYEGVRDFLKSRGIALPEGTPEDPPTAETVCGLGNRKNELVNELLASTGVEASQARSPSSVSATDRHQNRGGDLESELPSGPARRKS